MVSDKVYLNEETPGDTRPVSTLECASLRRIFHTSVNTVARALSKTSETGWTTGRSELSQAGQGHGEELGPIPGALAATETGAKTPESDWKSIFNSGCYGKNVEHPGPSVFASPGHGRQPRPLLSFPRRGHPWQGPRFKEKGRRTQKPAVSASEAGALPAFGVDFVCLGSVYSAHLRWV